MSAEKTGGAFFLQEVEPKTLIAVLVSTTPPQGPGVVLLAFGDDDPRTRSDVVTEIVFSWDVALRLLGVLQVLVAQTMCLRSEVVEWRFVPREPAAFAVRMRRGSRERGSQVRVFVSWATGHDGIVWNRDEEGGLEWRLREDLALELSYALLSALAHLASGIGSGPEPAP
jgi:hypothetical protein